MPITRAPQLRGKIIADAEFDDWRVREIKSRDGWPELYLSHEGDGVAIAAFVKDPAGKMTVAQKSVADSLRAAEAKAGGAFRVRIWRPQDRDAIEAELRTRKVPKSPAVE